MRWLFGYDEPALLASLGIDELVHTCPRCGVGAHGQPSSADRFVSIARAGAAVLVAVADGPVGIDLEPTAAQAPALAAHPSETGDPLRLWVRKEAILKATGLGLTVSPDTFWIAGARPSPIAGYAGLPLVVEDLDLPGYVAALASRLTA